jgi:hypothetical protein
MMDYAMVMGPDGVTCTLHTIGCPYVQAKRDAGEPVMNLIQCTRDPRDLDIELHCCLLEQPPREWIERGDMIMTKATSERMDKGRKEPR